MKKGAAMAGYPPAAAAKNSKDAADIYHGDADDAAHGSANVRIQADIYVTFGQRAASTKNAVASD